jgi:RNA polymerase sigma-70 factor (ECF subfamily)
MSAETLKEKEAELAGMFDEYYDRIARYAYSRTGDRASSEDIASEVFVKALKALPSYHERGLPMGAWLFRIAHNLVVDFLRQRAKKKTVPLDGIDLPSEVDPARAAETRMEMERVERAMKKLSPSQQEVVRLRFLAELSSKETAAAMGKSDGSVREMQSTAISRLKQLLSDQAL